MANVTDRRALYHAPMMPRLSTSELAAEWQGTRPGLMSEDRWEICVRVDRCLSWLEHADDIERSGVCDADSSLVFRWIATSALLSTWERDPMTRRSERELIGRLLDALLKYDR